ncbi:hypothetical protein T484DRAFT_1808882 [Baffinella frigidus]|nr:hypothetical protein T484DRAFT_1808882 [Cryptophyta sp. CCMP2293]
MERTPPPMRAAAQCLPLLTSAAALASDPAAGVGEEPSEELLGQAKTECLPLLSSAAAPRPVGAALIRVTYAACAVSIDLSAKPSKGSASGAAMLAPLLAMLGAAARAGAGAVEEEGGEGKKGKRVAAPFREAWREQMLLAATDAASPSLYTRLQETSPASSASAGPAAELAGALLALAAHGPPALASAARARLAALPLAVGHADALLTALSASLATAPAANARQADDAAPPASRKARKGAKDASAAEVGAKEVEGLPVAMVLLEVLQAHRAPAR